MLIEKYFKMQRGTVLFGASSGALPVLSSDFRQRSPETRVWCLEQIPNMGFGGRRVSEREWARRCRRQKEPPPLAP